MSFGGFILTNLGRQELAKAEIGQQLVFDYVAVGDGSSSGSAAALDALSHELYRLPILSVSRDGDTVIVDAELINDKLEAGFYFREIGLFANGVLYAYDNAGQDAEYIDAAGSVVAKLKRIRIALKLSSAASVMVKMEPGLYALYSDLRDANAEIEELKEGKVDKVVGKGLSSNDYTDAEKKQVAQIGNISNQANSAYSRANSAYSQANAAYNAANTASTTASSAYTKANSAATTAASAYTQANTAYNRANTAYNQANSAYSRANSAYSQANSAINKVSTLPIAIGDQLNLSGEYSIAIGLLTISRGDYSVAVGSYSKADTEYSTALGPFAKSEGAHSAAVGEGANAIGDRSVAFGYDASASGLNSAAIGANTIAGSMSSALGAYANACGNNTAAVGYGTYAVRDSDTAVGRNASASGGNSTALGCNAYTSTPNSMQLGNASMLSSLSCRVSLTTTSDERDKTDITEIGDGAVEFLKKVKAIRYVLNHRELYIDEENLPEDEKKKKEKYGLCGYDREAHAKGTKKGSRIRVGVSAQETQRALEEVYGSSSYANLINDNLFDVDPDEIPEGVENQLSANYEGFIPFLIKAVQELSGRLEAVEESMKGATTA